MGEPGVQSYMCSFNFEIALYYYETLYMLLKKVRKYRYKRKKNTVFIPLRDCHY